MKRHLIFFDIDGTLYNDDKVMSNRTKKTIKNLQNCGHILAIATGRAPFMIQDVLKETGIKNYISFNGQYAFADGEVIYKNALDLNMLKQLEKDATNHQHPIVFLTEKEMVSNVQHHHHIQESLNTLKIEHPRFENAYYEKKNIYQALIFHDSDEDYLYDYQYEKIKFIRWHEVSRDVVPFNGSKFEGIKQLSNYFNIPISDCIAIGDGLNDIEMIQGVGTGIVMGNGVPALKSVADIITGDVHDEGLTDAFIQLKLIER